MYLEQVGKPSCNVEDAQSQWHKAEGLFWFTLGSHYLTGRGTGILGTQKPAWCWRGDLPITRTTGASVAPERP